MKQTCLTCVLRKPFFFQLEIERINFKSDKAKPCLICCYAAASASEVGVKDLLPWLCIVFENPVIKSNRLLRWVDSLFVQALVSLHGVAFCDAFSLHHAGPHIPEHSH